MPTKSCQCYIETCVLSCCGLKNLQSFLEWPTDKILLAMLSLELRPKTSALQIRLEREDLAKFTRYNAYELKDSTKKSSLLIYLYIFY